MPLEPTGPSTRETAFAWVIAIVSIIAVITFASCNQSPRFKYYKAGMTQQQYEKDHNECMCKVKSEPVYWPGDGVLGETISAKMALESYNRCMESKGYVVYELQQTGG